MKFTNKKSAPATNGCNSRYTCSYIAMSALKGSDAVKLYRNTNGEVYSKVKIKEKSLKENPSPINI
jgi:predicted ATP-grasp superfamily ATP-dependent carboligase